MIYFIEESKKLFDKIRKLENKKIRKYKNFSVYTFQNKIILLFLCIKYKKAIKYKFILI
jgi:hypothetical protein